PLPLKAIRSEGAGVVRHHEKRDENVLAQHTAPFEQRGWAGVGAPLEAVAKSERAADRKRLPCGARIAGSPADRYVSDHVPRDSRHHSGRLRRDLRRGHDLRRLQYRGLQTQIRAAISGTARLATIDCGGSGRAQMRRTGVYQASINPIVEKAAIVRNAARNASSNSLRSAA